MRSAAAQDLSGVRTDGRSVVVGVGCSLGCPAEELLALVESCLGDAELAPGAVLALATVDRRATEPAVVETARRHAWRVETHPAAALAAVDVPTPSAVVAAHVGTPSVAEAAALLTAGDRAELLMTKRRSAHATCAVARPAPVQAP